MKKYTYPLLIVLGLIAGVAQAEGSKPFRESDEIESFEPNVKGDMSLSRTLPYWKDRSKVDPMLAGNPEEYWKLNWTFMDPPFNSAVHGGHFALDRGEVRFKELNNRGRFAQCLGAKNGSLKGLRVTYPRYYADLKKVAGLEEVIEHCAKQRGVVLENGSYDNSAVSLYVASFSNGIPMKIDVSKGPMKASWERGRQAYHLRTGRLNFACSSCHVRNIGRHFRGNVMTSPYGDATHYPVYRTRQELQSLQMRFVTCNLLTGTQPLRPGSDVYTDIEVFLTSLSNGHPVAVPSERD